MNKADGALLLSYGGGPGKLWVRRLLGDSLHQGEEKSGANGRVHPEEWSYQRASLPAMMEQFPKQAQLCRRRSILAIGHHSS